MKFYPRAGLLLAVLMLLAVFAGTARAETPPTLVSNLGEDHDAWGSVGPTAGFRVQRFTIPSGSDWTIRDLTLVFEAGTADFDIIVGIRNSGGNNPTGSPLFSLTPSSSLDDGGEIVFTAPRTAVLEGGKSYFVQIAMGGGSGHRNISMTDGDDEDSDSESGWSIRDTSRRNQTGWENDTRSIRMKLRGTPGRLATGRPVISGTPRVGQTLTSSTSSIADDDGLTTPDWTYQWIRVDGESETDISGATSSTYTLVDADHRKQLKLRVSFTDDNGTSETLTSSATAFISAGLNDASLANLGEIEFGLLGGYNTAIQLELIEWSPAFDPDVTEYSATSPLTADSVEWNDAPAPADFEATLELTYPDGTRDEDFESEIIELRAGGTGVMRLKVTAADGVTTRTYTFTILTPPALKGSLSDLPGSHDGSTAFTVSLSFDADVTSPLSRIRNAIEVSNGAVSNLAAVGDSKQDYTFDVTPRGTQRVRIRLRGSDTCDSSHSICASRKKPFPGIGSRHVGHTSDAELRTLWLRYPDGSYVPNSSAENTFGVINAHKRASYDPSRGVGLRLRAGTFTTGATIAFTGSAVASVASGSGTTATATLHQVHVDTDVTVTVTAEDGATTKTYTYTLVPDVTLACWESAYSALSSLTVQGVGGSLVSIDQAFDPAVRSYVAWMSPGTQSIDVSTTEENDEGFDIYSSGQEQQQRRQELVTESADPRRGERVFVDRVKVTTKHRVDGQCHQSRYYVKAYTPASPLPDGLYAHQATAYEQPGAELQFLVTLQGTFTGTVTVDYATSDRSAGPGRALAGLDYEATSGRLTFAPGETEKTVTVTVLDDSHDEGIETMLLEISNAYDARFVDDHGGAYVQQGRAYGVISNSELTATFDSLPGTHDGASPFTFRIAFSQATTITAEAMRDHALTVGGGTVTAASQVQTEDGLQNLWELTLKPSGRGEVSLLLPGNRACTEAGAVCASDDRPLSADVSGTVTGPDGASNAAPAGLPAISGTAQVGDTLTAGTSGISDADGLTNVSYSYQWIRNAGTDDSDISGATGTSYTLVDADQGKTIKVKVTFTDDGGTEETLVSEATGAVAPAPSTDPIWSTTLTVGVRSEYRGYSLIASPDFGSVSDDKFDYGTGASYQADAVLAYGEGVMFDVRNRGATLSELVLEWADETLPLADATWDASRHRYTWGQSWLDEHAPSLNASTYATTLSGGRTGTVCLRTSARECPSTTLSDPPPLTASFGDMPASHDGSSAFTFTLSFSEDVAGLSYKTLRDSAFDVTGGSVTNAGRQMQGSNQDWTITVTPDGDGDVTVTLPETTDCSATGAICIGDRPLSAAVSATVATRPNSPATGSPTITGTAQVGQTLTANTSGISDADGLTNVSYSYQWIRNDGTDDSDISGATGSAYSLVDADQGKTIKVKVTFTDDRDNNESLTSAATGEVAEAPSPLTVRLENEPSTHNGTAVFTFQVRFSEEFPLSYRTLRDHAFTVSGGEVKKANRLETGSNIGWLITVQPGSDAAVTISLPATTDCADDGAICTEDGRKLSNSLEFTVDGPG